MEKRLPQVRSISQPGPGFALPTRQDLNDDAKTKPFGESGGYAEKSGGSQAGEAEDGAEESGSVPGGGGWGGNGDVTLHYFHGAY